MTKIATGYVALKAEVDDLKRDLSKAQSELERSTTVMQGQAVKTGKSFKAMWLAYAAGAAVVAATAMKAIKAASDLQETTSKFNVVFKGQQKLAESWAKTLTESYAMSTREAKANLASIQDLLVPMGMAADAAGKMSFEVVKLSADLASFNNLPTEQVMLDIQSALVGNFETMKKYGVVLNATVVQQKAMEMGLAATKSELTAGMKAQAAYALMVEGSAAAIGDMARTSDSFANVAKQAQAAWEDFMAALGDLILPIATKVLSGLTSMMKGLNELIDDVKEAKGFADEKEKWAMQAAGREGDVLAEALGPGGPVGGGGGGGPSAAAAAQIIDMNAVMKEAKALREEDTIDLFSTLDAQEQYKQQMQDNDIARIATIQEAEREYREQKLIEIDEALQAEFELTERVQAETLAMLARYKQQEMKWDTTVAQHKQQTTKAWVNTAVMALQLFGKENKAATIAAITIQTAFAAAVAFMSAKAAALRALAELGPIAGAPVAAAIEAYGAMNVAAIIAQGAMQGAAVAMAGTGGGAGTVLTAQGEAQLTSPAIGAPEEEERGRVNIIIEGDILADELYIEMLAEKISEAVEGNEVRLIASETRAT